MMFSLVQLLESDAPILNLWQYVSDTFNVAPCPWNLWVISIYRSHKMPHLKSGNEAVRPSLALGPSVQMTEYSVGVRSLSYLIETSKKYNNHTLSSITL